MDRLVSLGFLFTGITVGLAAGPGAMDTLGVSWRADHFRQTDAEITGKYVKDHRKGPKTMVVKFKYEVDGHEYNGDNHYSSVVDRESDITKLLHHKGQLTTLPVYYDPDHPSICLIHPHGSFAWPLGVLLVTGASLAIGTVAAVQGRKERRARLAAKIT